MISTKEAALKLNNISVRRLRTLCAEGRIKGAVLVGGSWMVPDDPVVTAAGRERPGKIEFKAKAKAKAKRKRKP